MAAAVLHRVQHTINPWIARLSREFSRGSDRRITRRAPASGRRRCHRPPANPALACSSARDPPSVAQEIRPRGDGDQRASAVPGRREHRGIPALEERRYAVWCTEGETSGEGRFRFSLPVRPGGRGRLPARGSHRSGRARFEHPAPRTMDSLRNGTHCAPRTLEGGDRSCATRRIAPTSSARATNAGPATCAIASRLRIGSVATPWRCR